MTTRHRTQRQLVTGSPIVTDQPVTGTPVRPAPRLPPAFDGWFELFAENTRTAQAPGCCCLCLKPYSRGHRICDLAGGGEVAHVACVAGNP